MFVMVCHGVSRSVMVGQAFADYGLVRSTAGVAGVTFIFVMGGPALRSAAVASRMCDSAITLYESRVRERRPMHTCQRKRRNVSQRAWRVLFGLLKHWRAGVF